MLNPATLPNEIRDSSSLDLDARLKQAEDELGVERSLSMAILDTVGAFVIVLDPELRIVRFNRACEQSTGFSCAEMTGQPLSALFFSNDDADRFRLSVQRLRHGIEEDHFESCCRTRDGSPLAINWAATAVCKGDGAIRFVVATGIDRTEHKRLVNTILEISGREQRRIGQDLHDELGQHLTGIAFLTKVQEQKLAEKSLPEASDAAKIVNLVNQAIYKTRELARGLLPALSGPHGLMLALKEWASEVEDIFRVTCRFDCQNPVPIKDDAVGNHLFRIAQEAVHNAVRHGKAQNIVISLRAADGEAVLTIRDDGCGLPADFGNGSGMGLKIMNYRTRMVGGSLRVERIGDRGTRVACVFPLRKRSSIQ